MFMRGYGDGNQENYVPSLQQSQHEPGRSTGKRRNSRFATEYNTAYFPRYLDKQEPLKPKPEWQQNEGRIDDRTTHRDAYVAYPLGKHHVHEYEKYKRPEVEVEQFTSYRTDFTEKPIDKVQAIKREYGPKTTGDFEGKPSYKSDYRPHEINPREKISYAGLYEPSTVPFQGTSSYSTEFVARDAKPRSSKRPKETPREYNDQSLQNETSYRDSYKQLDLPKKFLRETPVWRENNTARLSSSTNYKSDFTQKDLTKTVSYKPQATAIQSTAPLGGDTTNRAEYKRWPMERRFEHQYPIYQRPSEAMSSSTTSHTDYVQKPIKREALIKPSSEGETWVSGQFEGSTSYRDEFKPYDKEQHTKNTYNPEYFASDVPFQGTPTYTTDYIQHGHARRSPIKPTETALKSEEPIETQTEYRTDFVKHALPEKIHYKKPEWNGPPATRLDGVSTYSTTYTAKDSARQESYKPKLVPLRTEAQFEDETTFRHDYKAYPTKPLQRHVYPAHIQREGIMESQTTHNTDFTPKPIEKVAAIRPPQGTREEGNFDGHTSYREEYRNWGTKDRHVPGTLNEYNPPDVPFAGRSSYKDEFITRPLEMTLSTKKNEGGYASNAPFEDATEYRNEYSKRTAAARTTAQGNETGQKIYESSVPKLPQINNQQPVLTAA